MKKLTAMLLALTLCFGLAACGGNTAQDDTKDESQTVQTGKTEDKKDEAKTKEKSDETKTEDAKTETKTDDKTSTDSKTEDKTNETKPVTSSTNTTTAKPSASAGTSKPSASTSKPAASAPASKPAQSKPAASAPARDQTRRTGEADCLSGERVRRLVRIRTRERTRRTDIQELFAELHGRR